MRDGHLTAGDVCSYVTLTFTVRVKGVLLQETGPLGWWNEAVEAFIRVSERVGAGSEGVEVG